MTKRQLFTRLCELADALQAECARLDFSPHKIALEALVERLDVLIDVVLEEGVIPDDEPWRLGAPRWLRPLRQWRATTRQTTPEVPEVPEPLRLYRFADAPPALRALSDAGGGEVLVAVVPAAWLEEAVLNALPHVLWLLLASSTGLDWPMIEGTWGAVQRVAQDDGSYVVIVSRP